MPNESEIRPFRVDMPDEAIADLRRLIAATRWPTKELVDDRSQGVQLAAPLAPHAMAAPDRQAHPDTTRRRSTTAGVHAVHCAELVDPGRSCQAGRYARAATARG